jgi:16S rRNA (uracil1498-N3)-methyltransferase
MTTNQFFIEKSQIDSDGVVTLEGSDARHIRLVLRLKKGSRIRLVDEDRNSHMACVEKVAEKAVTVRIEESSAPKPPESGESSESCPGRRTIIQGIPRLPKADLIVQKLTELGVEGILFAPTERTPYRDGESRISARIERLQRIAESAAKQCSRSNIPDVGFCMNLEAALESVGPDALMLVADESARSESTGKSLRDNLQNSHRKSDIAVFIGPEGGFSENETEMLKDAGAKPFSLGRNILRTETAAIVAAALVLYEIGEI